MMFNISIFLQRYIYLKNSITIGSDDDDKIVFNKINHLIIENIFKFKSKRIINN